MRFVYRPVVSSVMFLAALFVFHISGVLPVDFALISSFILMVIGVSSFAQLAGQRRPLIYTVSGFLFFAGLLWFLEHNLRIQLNTPQYIIALSLFAGISMLLAFIDNPGNNKYLYTAVLVITSSVTLFFMRTSINFTEYIYWFTEIIETTWLAMLLLVLYVLYLNRHS